MFGRSIVLLYVIQFIENENYVKLLSATAFCVGDVIRYTFYNLKLLNIKEEESSFASFIGFMRYNLWLILYPTGMFSEFLMYQ